MDRGASGTAPLAVRAAMDRERLSGETAPRELIPRPPAAAGFEGADYTYLEIGGKGGGGLETGRIAASNGGLENDLEGRKCAVWP